MAWSLADAGAAAGLRSRRLTLGLILPLALLLLASPALAQMDSREGIALQNQILQLRQEMEQLRGRGGSLPAPSTGRAPAGGGELVGQLLDRVNTLEEELRRQRGRVEVLENQNRRLAEDLEKLRGDMEYRLGQGGGQGGGGAAAAPARPAAGPPTTSTGAAAPRTPDRALAEGQAALGRRDYANAEAAAREALAARSGAPVVAGQMLLGEALMGKRDFGNAAIAFNEAYTRARTGPRAPEALLGLANAFQGLGNRREACDTLNDLRSRFPNLSGAMLERANAARQRGQCR
jgi:TolA-binding protein